MTTVPRRVAPPSQRKTANAKTPRTPRQEEGEEKRRTLSHRWTRMNTDGEGDGESSPTFTDGHLCPICGRQIFFSSDLGILGVLAFAFRLFPCRLGATLGAALRRRAEVVATTGATARAR